MKVILFGATGMVGQGVLRECLLAGDVDNVLAIGRTGTGQQHAKLQEIVRSDLFDLCPMESRLSGFDACFFCLGISAAGMSEQDYRRVTWCAKALSGKPGHQRALFLNPVHESRS